MDLFSGSLPAIALAWRMFYLGVIQETPKNPSASGRSELMGGIIELLEDN